MQAYEFSDEEDKARGSVLQQLMSMMDDRIANHLRKNNVPVPEPGSDPSIDGQSDAKIETDVKGVPVEGESMDAEDAPSSERDDLSDISDEDLRNLLREKRGR